MASIPASVERIKGNPLELLDRDRIERVCRECDHHWRDRALDPATTVALFMQQVLHGNVPCTEVRLVGRALSPPMPVGSFTAQAYCDARARLPLAVYQALLAGVNERVLPHTRRGQHLWHGHRTFHIDGSTFSMPDTPELRKAFGMPSGQQEGCGFPVAHLLVLFSAATGLLIDAWASPLRTGDLADAPEAHLHLDEGDVLIGDDFYGGYPHLALLQKQGLHGLFPAHHLRIVDFKKGRPHCGEGKPVKGMPRSRWVRSLGKEDQLVEYFKPPRKPEWMSGGEWESLPESILVRELRRTVVRPGLGKVTLTLVTTLLDPEKYPAAELLGLRLGRGDEHRVLEDDDGHGRASVQERRGRAQGADGLRDRVQPGAGGDAGGGAAAGGGGEPHQLHRRLQVDAPRPPRRRPAGAGGEPVPARPRRAALQETAAQAI